MTKVFPSRDKCPSLSLSHTFPCPSSRDSNLGGLEKLEFPSCILTRNQGHFLLRTMEKNGTFLWGLLPLNCLISFCVAFIRRFRLSVAHVISVLFECIPCSGRFPGHDNRTWLVYMCVKAIVCHTKKPISVYFLLTGGHLDGSKV